MWENNSKHSEGLKICTWISSFACKRKFKITVTETRQNFYLSLVNQIWRLVFQGWLGCLYIFKGAFLVAKTVKKKKKNLSAMQKTGIQSPGLGRSPGESHGQKSLVGYSPWGHEESDTTEQPTLSHLQEPRSFLYSFFFFTCITFIMPCLVLWTAHLYSITEGGGNAQKKVCTSMTHLKTFLKIHITG